MQIGTIHQIPRKEAFINPENSSVWMHIFSSYGVPIIDFRRLYSEKLGAGSRVLGLPRPVWMAFSDLENFIVPQIHMECFPGTHGEMVILPHNYDIILPKSCFVLLSTPYRDGDSVYDDASALLEKLRGLFCLLFGRNFLYQKVMSAEVYNFPSNKIDQITKDLRFTAVANGPYVHIDNAHEVEEIAIAITLASDQDRTRIESSIHYFVRGLEDDDVFLFLWTAIEMLCGRNTNRPKFVRETLKTIYQNSDINSEFGFTKLENIRDNWLHKGVIPSINHDTLRYMQLMFLDILRHKLRLPRKNHLAAICSSRNFNLSDIGLPDNSIPRARPIIRTASPEEIKLRSTAWCKIAEL